jgi:isopenicillin N synthase-like dioxygenase
MAVAFKTIPVIDFAAFYSNDLNDKISVGKAIRKACEDVGFLYIVNHSVKEQTINEVNCQDVFI